MPQELSTKWWNIIRREMRKPCKAYDDVVCPDCGMTTFLMKGRYGRFYRCDHYYCKGTVGARMDGTPSRERGTPEEIEARHRARDAVHALTRTLGYMTDARNYHHLREADEKGFRVEHIVPAERFDHLPDSEGFMVTYLHGLDTQILEEAGVGPVMVLRRCKKGDYGIFSNGKIPEVRPGMFLRRRTVEEAQRIEAAAIRMDAAKLEELRKLRNNVWDRLVLMGEEHADQVGAGAPVNP